MNNYASREVMIQNLQIRLKRIRQAFQWEQGELGEMIGVSRQTINNIENWRSPLNATQYVALVAIIDKKIQENPTLQPLLEAILKMELDEETKKKIKEKSFFKDAAKYFGIGLAAGAGVAGIAGAIVGGALIGPVAVGGLLASWLQKKGQEKK